jgi:hypothetical protein
MEYWAPNEERPNIDTGQIEKMASMLSLKM